MELVLSTGLKKGAVSSSTDNTDSERDANRGSLANTKQKERKKKRKTISNPGNSQDITRGLEAAKERKTAAETEDYSS